MAKHNKKELVKLEIDGVFSDAKECSKCKVVKSLELFSTGKSLGGKSAMCKECYKDNYNKNKNKIIQKSKKRYEENKEVFLLNSKRWKENNNEKYKDITKKSYHKNKQKYADKRNAYQEKWIAENPEKVFENRVKSRSKLPFELSKDEYLKIKNSNCWLSNSEKSEIDHFISMKTGHGGTYEGNLMKLSPSLNKSKGNNNPFEWIKTRKEHEKNNFNKSVGILAEYNGLSVCDFKDFVYWCYENQREENDILKDNRFSIQIWRERDEQNIRETTKS